MINITITPFGNISTNMSYTGHITESCFTWCKGQVEIHAKNLEINDLSLIVVALISLLLNNIIYNHSDSIAEKFNLKEGGIEILFDATYITTFLMLIIHIIYMVFFR